MRWRELSEVLIVENLCVKYYTKRGIVLAVSDATFSMLKGEMLAVVGESGSGKSTLGHAIMNLLPKNGVIEKGRVLLDGIDILKLGNDDLRRIRGSKISMVFQDPFTTLDPLRRVLDQFTEFLTEHGVDMEEARDLAMTMLEAVGIPKNLANAYPHQLSGGQKQRVAIAMAIALKPLLVIADEPTTALDVVVQKQIMDLFDEIKNRGTSIMLITHDIALALERADRVMIMYGGEVMELAEKGVLMEKPLHPYTIGLLSSVPKIGSEKFPNSIPGYPPDLRNPPRGCVFHPRCSHAGERCRVVKPLLTEVEKGHWVKCHLVKAV